MVITRYKNATDSISVNPEYRNVHLTHRYDFGFSHIVVSANILSATIYSDGLNDQSEIDRFISETKKKYPNTLVIKPEGMVYQINLYEVLKMPEDISHKFKLENGQNPTHILTFMQQPDMMAATIIDTAEKMDGLHTNEVVIDERKWKYGKEDEES